MSDGPQPPDTKSRGIFGQQPGILHTRQFPHTMRHLPHYRETADGNVSIFQKVPSRRSIKKIAKNLFVKTF